MKFVLNGTEVSVENVAPHITLLDYVRSRGLTGSKEGCAEGECGACAVLLIRPRPNVPSSSELVAVNSCLMLLGMAADQEIYTVEGLARDGKMSPAQQALVDNGGSQCGYCTPGFVVSLFAELYRPDRSGPCDPHAMAGNLCRCTGYRPIRDAACSLGSAPQDEFALRLQALAPRIGPCEERSFYRPGTLAELLHLIQVHPQARLIAGGTDLIVENNLRGKRFEEWISLEAVPELRVFGETPDSIEIGAGLTLTEIGRLWTDTPPVIKEWLELFASPLIRNRATLGGNLATASPIGDSAPLLLALDASVRIAGPFGERLVPLNSFFVSYRTTALEGSEVIVSVIVPKPVPSLLGFFKVAKRRMDDISTVAACFAVGLDAAGRIHEARVAYGGVAATPIRVHAAEAALAGRPWNDETVADAQEAIAATLRPLSDHRGSAAYRLAVAQSLLEKFLFQTTEVPV